MYKLEDIIKYFHNELKFINEDTLIIKMYSMISNLQFRVNDEDKKWDECCDKWEAYHLDVCKEVLGVYDKYKAEGSFMEYEDGWQAIKSLALKVRGEEQ